MQVGAARASAAGIVGLVALGWFGSAAPAYATEPPPRPPLPEAPPPTPVPWERHLEFGPDLAIAALVASRDAMGVRTPVRFSPTAGFGLHLTVDLLRYLRFSAYFVDARHKMTLPTGSLGLP